MLNKFSIEYVLFPEHNDKSVTHRTNDPVEAEDFLKHLLLTGASIRNIRHEGAELTEAQSDRMIRLAAERLAASLIGRCLSLDAASLKHRFGFAA